jgi:RNA polymerase sigma factor (sigma-70 family)
MITDVQVAFATRTHYHADGSDVIRAERPDRGRAVTESDNRLSPPQREALFNQHVVPVMQELLSVARRKVGNNDAAANDIVQHVLLKAYQTISQDKVESKGRFLAWLFRILHTTNVDQWRSLAAHPTHSLERDDGSSVDVNSREDAPDHQVERQEILQKIAGAVAKLPPDEQFVIRFHCLECRTYKETAERKGLKIHQIQTLEKHAISFLKGFLIGEFKEFIVHLPADEQCVIHWRHFKGLSYAETAKRMSIEENRVESLETSAFRLLLAELMSE